MVMLKTLVLLLLTLPLSANPALERAHLGISVVDVETGQSLYAKNPEKAFAPCSVAKLWTAQAALEQLGSDHRFVTRVWITHEGDLVLEGGGDPLLKTEDLRGLAQQTAESVVEVRDLIVDSRRIRPHINPEAQVEDIAWYYAPEVCALSINGNACPISISPAKYAGDPLAVDCDLDICVEGITVKDDVAQGYFLVRTFDGEGIKLIGSMGQSTPPDVGRAAVPSPHKHAGRLFAQALADEGVSVGGKVVERPWEEGSLVAEHHSSPLRDVARYMLVESDNLTADLLYRAAPTEVVADGSGFSMKTAVTPAQTTQLLLENPGLKQLLPNGRKTGARMGYHALAGYATTSEGRPVVYAIYLNHHTLEHAEARKAIDDLLSNCLQ